MYDRPLTVYEQGVLELIEEFFSRIDELQLKLTEEFVRGLGDLQLQHGASTEESKDATERAFIQIHREKLLAAEVEQQ